MQRQPISHGAVRLTCQSLGSEDDLSIPEQCGFANGEALGDLSFEA